MLISQDTLIAIREFLPPSNEPPLLLYLGIGIFIGVVVVIMKFERYKKIRELFMKLF
ncbi:MAG: hypothetical protein PHX44_01120 [Sulfurimonas sp.]|uniref:hypothetical protein n=1 Tax=Sulfurimonas sp. TaxID=2022749 RepID=UPI002615DBB6|nr:hypothetical protein [Sulfurimonas sp.]MDD2651634.1 hypothetical protein [Sulfurimonas sp.]MDD3451445.1 hypothetical protein [Sulfurimonas sp.]